GGGATDWCAATRTARGSNRHPALQGARVDCLARCGRLVDRGGRWNSPVERDHRPFAGQLGAEKDQGLLPASFGCRRGAQMNCQQIDEWLPLYASRDLDERREHLVVAHLQTCASCAKAAAEYRETQDLMHGFGVPAVTDEVYAQIRQQVWRRIEA